MRSWCLTYLHAPLMALALLPLWVSAGPLLVTVTDPDGNRLNQAVVSVHFSEPQVAEPFTVDIMDQVDRQFLPTVLPIQQGTQVSFPNTDDVRHHVYSFSAPNTFEIKLYHGRPAKPVTFEHPGVVVLGCNIHDKMLGYLRVVDTPLFAATADDGLAAIEVPIPGEYTLQVWHPDMGMSIHHQPVTTGATLKQITVAIQTSPRPAAAKPEAGSDKDSLQSLFEF